MFELLPLCSGFALGLVACIFSRAAGRFGILAAIALLALVATVASGEATRSWAYFAVDFVQTAAGFAVGFAGVARLRRRPSHR
jgi:hypothetical protein